MDFKTLSWQILFCFCFVHVFVETIVVLRGTRDAFSNPIQENCIHNKSYCLNRKAICLRQNCCSCECFEDYNTFHSPGVVYYIRNGYPTYRFDGKESCVWNHYAHEGCRFIEEHASTSTRRFLPLINLNKNGTLLLRTGLEQVYQCNHSQLFTKRPLQRSWVGYEGENIFSTEWQEKKDIHLTLKWQDQGPKYGGLLFKMNFSCGSVRKLGSPEPCVILKIKGSYDTAISASEVQDTTRIQDQQILNVETTPKTTPKTTPGISKPRLDTTQGPKIHTDMTNQTETFHQKATESTTEERGDTFWILVYVFMAFAIFEVVCVAVFLIYRQRRKRRKRRNNSEPETPANYDNHGMTIAPETTGGPPSRHETIELQENNECNEPRYSVLARRGEPPRDERSAATLENGVVVNTEPSEPPSRHNSRILKSGSIIVLPRDCVIVHSSGSRSSRHSKQGEEGQPIYDKITLKNKEKQNSEDNKSLYSWESSSTLYRTSTDEDYASGSNPAPGEEDSLYEEPDKVLSVPREQIKPPLPPMTFGVERLFSLRETAIPAPGDSVEDVGNEDDEDDEEHIYESAESVIPTAFAQYDCEDTYDLPEDALAKGYEKANKGSLKHVLHEERPEEEAAGASLNLGFEFVNNDEDDDGSDDVKLRPKRQSTVYLREMSDTAESRTSVC